MGTVLCFSLSPRPPFTYTPHTSSQLLLRISVLEANKELGSLNQQEHRLFCRYDKYSSARNDVPIKSLSVSGGRSMQAAMGEGPQRPVRELCWVLLGGKQDLTAERLSAPCGSHQ